MRFKNWKYPEIREGRMTRYNWLVQNKGGLKLGKMTDIGAFTYINAKYGVVIGDNAQLGSHCSIYSVSTIDNKKGKVSIGKNSCVGSHSVVMPGVKIGKDCLVGAFSFVNKDIPDGCVAFGVPAKVIKKKAGKK